MSVATAQTPELLLDQLKELFPQFECDLEIEDLTFHAVLMDFTPFFARAASAASEKQLKTLAAMINAAADSSGSLENAFDTCFFEGLRRSVATKLLRPFLSATVKRRSHA
jgi:hypothetical protein